MGRKGEERGGMEKRRRGKEKLVFKGHGLKSGADNRRSGIRMGVGRIDALPTTGGAWGEENCRQYTSKSRDEHFGISPGKRQASCLTDLPSFIGETSPLGGGLVSGSALVLINKVIVNAGLG